MEEVEEEGIFFVGFAPLTKGSSLASTFLLPKRQP